VPPVFAISASTSAVPMPRALAWLTNTSRCVPGASVSEVSTWMPFARASAITPASAAGSLGATTMTSTFLAMRSRTIFTCAAGSTVWGPVVDHSMPSCFAASRPPVSIASKYGMPPIFGTNAIRVGGDGAGPPPRWSEQPPSASTAPSSSVATSRKVFVGPRIPTHSSGLSNGLRTVETKGERRAPGNCGQRDVRKGLRK
jgi:hypothetical protein